ncbi:MAG: FAD-dependent oxidoreductase, partial [Peptococcus niger]
MSKKVIIVGGVAGGASCAARLRRLDEAAEIILLERGNAVSFANCGLPYHISGCIAKRDALILQTPESLHSRFNLDVRLQATVTAIDRAGKRVHVTDGQTGKTYT